MISALAYVLITAGTITSLGNWIGVIHWYTRKRRTSLIPLLGGVLGFLGCVAHPDIDWKWGFLALGLDPWWVSMTGVPYLVESAWKAIRKPKPASHT